MKINWKVRFIHKPFLIALFALVMLLVQRVASFFGVDTTNL
ncbi:phage holin [Psychrobacillus psychrodurans]